MTAIILTNKNHGIRPCHCLIYRGRILLLKHANIMENVVILLLLLLLLMTFIGRKLRHAANAPSQPLHDYSYPRTGTFSVVS